MIPIAHRGFWFPDATKQNTPAALLAATERGWGVETDVRSWDEQLVIKHDSVDALHAISEIQVLSIYSALPAFEKASLVCWNLKDRTAEVLLHTFLLEHALAEKSVVFDMELYDRAAGFVRVSDLFGPERVVCRSSERLEEKFYPDTASPASGIWMDTWDRDWVTAREIAEVQATGRRAWIVSPELHHRPIRLAEWRAWAEADGICTDYPHLLEATLAGELERPARAWWAGRVV